MQQWRRVERKHDEHVHRAIRPQARGADFPRQPHAAIDFHGARIDALHLRQERRARLLLDQNSADAAPPEIDGKRQSGRSRTYDQNVAIHRLLSTPRRMGRRQACK